MSYTQKPTTLIARRGYSDLGYTLDEQKLPWCGDLSASSTQICRSDNNTSGSSFGSNRGASQQASGSGGTLSTIGGFLGSVLGGAVKQIGTTPSGVPIVLPPQGPPSWLMPVAIGGIGIAAILLLRRKRPSGAPVSNPSRRRRRRR